MVIFGVAVMTLIPIATPSVLAACHGQNVPFASTSGWGWEGAQSGTCDNLGDYYGIYKDTASDGFLVRIRTRNINGNAGWVYTGYTTGQNTNTFYGYADPNKSTQYQICRSGGVCATEGSNWGF